MIKPAIEGPRGILYPEAGAKNFQLSRRLPSRDLQLFIEHYWIVTWDLRGQSPYLSETLPYPAFHLVIEKDKSKIHGIVTGKFSILLQDKGRVFGIKFRPGAFYPFVHTSASSFTNSTMSFSEIFGPAALAVEATVLASEDEEAMVNVVEKFIRAYLPPYDEHITTINRVIDTIATDRTIIKVDDVVERLVVNKRQIQRLFSQYVGVGPKWVIKRYRLHEAATTLDRGEINDWPQLALDIGYFDQAHFIKDFKAIIGKTPQEYVRQKNEAIV